MAKTSGETPKAIQLKPNLCHYLNFVITSFFVLSMSRNYTSVGASYIPFTVYISWLNENNIFDAEERDELISYFLTLDSKYIEVLESKRS